MAEELRDRALVLGAVDYGESDRIVTLLTRGGGKLGAFARGARASKKRFAGALAPFTLLSVRLVPRRGELFGLASCEVEQAFLGLRDSLEAISLAGYAAELCRELCRDREPHPELFDGLRAYLGALAGGRLEAEDRLAFELGAIDAAGLSPRLDACVRCGGEVGGRLCFSPGQGGLLCGVCAPRPAGGALLLAGEAIDLLRRLQPGPARAGRVGEPAAGYGAASSPQALRESRRALRAYLRHHLGKELRSLTVLEQLGFDERSHSAS